MRKRNDMDEEVIFHETKDILLESAMESFFDGIIITDNRGKIILHNSKFCEIWKIPNELIEKNNEKEILRYALKQAETPELFYKRIRRIWKNEEKDFGLLNLTDGRIIEYFTTSLMQKGEKIGYIGIFRDITEKTRLLIKLEEYTINLEKIVKQRTNQINNLNKQLKEEVEKTKLAERIMSAALQSEKEVSQLKSSFISSASHEFKTPMTTILSSIDLIDSFWKSKNYEKFTEHKDKIKTKARGIIKLIDDVLVVHQIEKNVVKLDIEEMNLKHVIEELLDEVRVIDNQNHEIIFTYTGNKDIIKSDPRIFRHVVGNLMVNAVKYSPGSGKIELDVNITDTKIKIMVADEGPGIDQSSINRIFEPFERAQSARDKEGAGLGLSIVRYILNLCGGDIEVISKKNKGTKFFVTIPLSDNE